jgi:uncharacterized protein (TIGR00269 family)
MRVKLRNPDRTVDVAGPATVRRVLEQLEVNPETVLVIRDGELVTRDRELPDEAEVEVRPVISGGAGPARCQRCRGPAAIEVPRHRAAWCAEHFVDHVQTQVRRAIDEHRMCSYDDRILVAVSGGKDSLALWDALLDMGYRADALYLGLGIGGYSTRSERIVREFAERRGPTLHVHDLADDFGFDIPEASRDTRRSACGVCGLSKRYVFNRVALENGYDVMATGHNLDDEAATLLGNVLRWQRGFLARQRPVLPATGANQVRKCKPMYRLSERETAAYCVVRGIDYVVEECPLVDGNTGHDLKSSLDLLEAGAPGLKAQFLFGFLDEHGERFEEPGDGEVALGSCASCGMPTTGETCAFCRQRERIANALPVAASGPAR